MRTGSILISALTATALFMCGCMDDAAAHHRQQAEAVKAAADDLRALSPDVQIASTQAEVVLSKLRGIDVQSGPLASVRNSLSAQARMVIARAAMDEAGQARRDAASLTGRIEARLHALQRMSAWVTHAPFDHDVLGGPNLTQDIQTRDGLKHNYQTRIDDIRHRIDQLEQQRTALADEVSQSRLAAHQQRAAAMAAGDVDTALDEIDAAAHALKDLSPRESALDLMDLQIEALHNEQQLMQFRIDGESARIEVDESEMTEVDAFVRSRNDQINRIRDRQQALSDQLAADAKSLSDVELGELSQASTQALEGFASAAADAQRAARQAGRAAEADRLLELSARQAAVSIATDRWLSLARSAALLEALAQASASSDAAAAREQARTIASRRDEAMQKARELLQAAGIAADQLGQGTMAQSIRTRLESVQHLLDGKTITVQQPAIAAPTATTVATPAASDGRGSAPVPASGSAEGAVAVARAFMKDSSLGAIGDTSAAQKARAVCDCATHEQLCRSLDMSTKLLPALSECNSLAASTFKGLEAAAIAQIQMMFDPQTLRGMMEPMLEMTPMDVTTEGEETIVKFETPPGSWTSVRLKRIGDVWKVVGGATPAGEFGSETHIKAIQDVLDSINTLKASVQSGSITAGQYLQQFQNVAAKMQTLSGDG